MDANEFLFSDQKPAAAVYSNTEHGAHLAQEIKRVVRQAYYDAPRTRQRRPGPSQLGGACDRRIVAHFLELPKVNRMTDPWAAIVGTGTHLWLASAFELDNRLRRDEAVPERWRVELKVAATKLIRGSTDLYDRSTFSVIDHKVLGPTTHGALKKSGPGVSYEVQLLLYAAGLEADGERVDHIAIAAYPRAGQLTGLYVWTRPFDQEARDQLAAAIERTNKRAKVAEYIERKLISLDDVKAKPSAKECRYCDFYARTVPPEPGVFYCTGRGVVSDEEEN